MYGHLEAVRIPCLRGPCLRVGDLAGMVSALHHLSLLLSQATPWGVLRNNPQLHPSVGHQVLLSREPWVPEDILFPEVKERALWHLRGKAAKHVGQ